MTGVPVGLNSTPCTYIEAGTLTSLKSGLDIIRSFYMQKQKLFGGDPLGRINKDDGES